MTQYQTIELNKIILPEGRQREDYGDIDELAESIQELGLLQPLGVEEKSMRLVWGGRRYSAIRALEWERADCRIVPEGCSELELEAIELEENIRRKDLTSAEECRAYKRIDDLKKALLGDAEKDRVRSGWSKRKTARLLGESPSGVAEKIRLAEAMEILPELENCKTMDEMRKTFKSAVEDTIIKSVVTEGLDSQNSSFKFAAQHYNIGDFFDGIKDVAKSPASFAIVDPPYAIDLTQQKKVDVDLRNIGKYTEWKKSEYLEKISGVASELHRVLADNSWIIWWFGIEWYQPVLDVLTSTGFEVNPVPAIWYKLGATGQSKQPSVHLGNTYETFFVARKGNPALAKRGKPNTFVCKPVSSQKKIHTTEKPLTLMKEIFEIFTFPGTVFIVPFLGSGVDLRAGYSLGLTGFGWDLSQDNKDKFLFKVSKDIEEGAYKTNGGNHEP